MAYRRPISLLVQLNSPTAVNSCDGNSEVRTGFPFPFDLNTQLSRVYPFQATYFRIAHLHAARAENYPKVIKERKNMTPHHPEAPICGRVHSNEMRRKRVPIRNQDIYSTWIENRCGVMNDDRRKGAPGLSCSGIKVNPQFFNNKFPYRRDQQADV